MVIKLDETDSLYTYKCPFCSYKNKFKNSLIFDRWIKITNVRMEEELNE